MRPLQFIILLSVSFIVYGQQNLIPNPSFEKRVNFGNISSASEWNKVMVDDTPDYFIFSYDEHRKPEYDEFIGRPEPRSGNRYVGIFCYRVNPIRGVSDIREALQVKLEEPLQKDSTYVVSFYVALDPESTHAIRNLHVFFNDGLSVFRNSKKLFRTYPRITFSSSWLADTTWMHLTTEYKAGGNEKYMIIGNLSNDKSTGKRKVDFSFPKEKLEKWNLYASEDASYYYIDDLSLRIKSKVVHRDIPVESIPDIEIVEEDSISLDEVKRDTVFILRKIYFEFDEADLKPESTVELNRLLQFLNRHPEIRIHIEGHTDNIGSFEYNIRLSEARARSVTDYLVQHGIDPGRLEYKGYGYTRPITGNQTEEDRQMNRRVAFRIIEYEQE